MSQGDPVGELRGARGKWIKRNVGRKPTKFLLSQSFDARFCAALAEPSPFHPVINLRTAAGRTFFNMPIEVREGQAEEIVVEGAGLNKSRRRRRYSQEPAPGFEGRTIVLTKRKGDDGDKFRVKVDPEAEKPPVPEGAEEVAPYDAAILEADMVEETEKPKRRRYSGGKEQNGPKPKA